MRRVSPAHAGMYLSQPRLEHQRHRFPRTRGDVPTTALDAVRFMAFPPHTRGCTWMERGAVLEPEVSPAHAGMCSVQLEYTLAQHHISDDYR